MKLSKGRMVLIFVLGVALGYQVFMAFSKDKVEPFPYVEGDMGQIRPGFYK